MSARRPVALVTGGQRGIGFGIATALARAGFDLAIADLPEDEPAGVLDPLRLHGGDAIYVHADLAAIGTHAPAVSAVVERYGRIDCLVNNAGRGSVVRGDFLDLTPANFDAVMTVNLKGSVFFTQEVVRAMLKGPASHSRSIINITSISAGASSPERLDYCISKAGLSAFSQGLALRLAEDGIAVFEVRPGIIRSDMTAGVAEKYDRFIAQGNVPMKRWGEPEDLGRICAALASGDLAFATGSVIDADGGLSIPRL